MKRFCKMAGITLIELMIVVAVIGILASIAYPAYQDQMTKSRRTDGHTELMSIMNAQERFYTNFGSYTTSLTAAAPVGLNLPDVTSDEGHYTLAAAACGAGIAQCVLLTATAGGVQASDGNLTLNSQGVKTPANKW